MSENDKATCNVTAEEMLEGGRVALAESVEWYVNCLEYGMGVPGAVWVRPEENLASLLALV